MKISGVLFLFVGFFLMAGETESLSLAVWTGVMGLALFGLGLLLLAKDFRKKKKPPLI